MEDPNQQYEIIRDVPIFKEHAYFRTVMRKDGKGPEFDGDGNVKRVVEHYDLKALRAIVDNCNKRVKETQTFAPITDVHTGRKPDGSKERPEVYGFAGPFRLGMYGMEDRDDGEPMKGKWAIYEDEFWFKDKAHKAREMARRSPEVYVGRPIQDRFLDPITALGAETPALDMGIHYNMNDKGELVERYSAPNMTVIYDGAAAFAGPTNVSVPHDVKTENKKAKYDEWDDDLVEMHNKSQAWHAENIAHHKSEMDKATAAGDTKAANKHQKFLKWHTNEHAANEEAASVAKRKKQLPAAQDMGTGQLEMPKAKMSEETESDEKPPKSLPNEGHHEYRGFKLSKFDGTQVGHSTEGGGLKKTLGMGTHRKVSGVSSIDPEGYERVHNNLREAIAHIHSYHGIEEPSKAKMQQDLHDLVARYAAADPETVNACVAAMLETQPIMRILKFLESQEAPVQQKVEMAEDMAAQATAEGIEAEAAQQMGPDGKPVDESQVNTGDNPPSDEGEEDQGQSDSPPAAGDQPPGKGKTRKGKDKKMADAPATPPVEDKKDEKEKYEMQEFMRDMKVKYDQQQAEIAELRASRDDLVTERNSAVREAKISKLARVYAFDEKKAIAKYSQASEDVFQTWADTIVETCERLPIGGPRLHIDPMDLPESQEVAAQIGQYGGVSLSETEAIVQYQLEKSQQGEYLTWDQAKEAWEEKADKRAKKQAKREAAAS